jgi:hypothetical protein
MTGSMIKSVGALSPLGDALPGDGLKLPGPKQPAARRPAKGRPREAAGYEGWQCPRCGQEFPAGDAARHLIAEMNGLSERLAQMAAAEQRTGRDDLGNLLAHGPDDDARPAVWLRWKDLMVDPSVQREQHGRHRLLRPDAVLDYDKTEALTVVPVHERGGDGEARLIGYRVVEGQHRTILGQRADPEGWQLCKIIPVETRQEEAAIGREIASTRSPFANMDTWFALLRQEQPNVVAATQLLSDRGYLVSPNRSRYSIAAVSALFRITGVRNPRKPDVTAAKTPEAGAADLADVLTALEGVREDERDLGGRFQSPMLHVVYEIISDNRDRIDVRRLRAALGIRTAEGWMALFDRNLGGRLNIRAYMVRSYCANMKRDNPRRIS